jgi:cell wall-associated NlpC family hydrolase
MNIGPIVAAVVAALLLLVAVAFVAVVIFFMTLTNSGSSCGGPATLTADGSPTILGPATLSAAQIAGWWQAHGHGQATPVGVDIATLAGWYIDHGTAEGVRGDYAFAQAIEETTQGGVGFNSPAAHRNNFAGIGITGSGVNGYDFASPEAGVVAQLQLLKEVVGGNSVPFAEPRVAPTWGGRSASTWAGLAGNWAQATDYWDPAIKSVYASMSAGQAPPSGPTTTAPSGPTATLVSSTTCGGAAGGVGLPIGGNLGPLWAFLNAQLGKPYQWGGTGPDSWDCSGLMMVGWAQVGITLPRVAVDQYRYTQAVAVPLSALQQGDLVFWGPSLDGIDHVAIYVGNGQILDAPHSGTVVQVQAIWTDGLIAATRPAAAVAAAATMVAAK